MSDRSGSRERRPRAVAARAEERLADRGPYITSKRPELSLLRAIRRSFVSISRVIEVRLDRRRRPAELLGDLRDRQALCLAVMPRQCHRTAALTHPVGKTGRHLRRHAPERTQHGRCFRTAVVGCASGLAPGQTGDLLRERQSWAGGDRYATVQIARNREGFNRSVARSTTSRGGKHVRKKFGRAKTGPAAASAARPRRSPSLPQCGRASSFMLGLASTRAFAPERSGGASASTNGRSQLADPEPPRLAPRARRAACAGRCLSRRRRRLSSTSVRAREFIRRPCDVLPVIRSSFPRRQQHRRLRRAAASGAGATAAGAVAIIALAAGALALAGVLALVTVGLLLDTRRWLRLAGRSRVGARSEDAVRGALAALEAEGWRVRHSLPFRGRGDIDSIAIAPTGLAFAIETKCAARRLVVSPVQPGGTRREVLGSNGLPGSER